MSLFKNKYRIEPARLKGYDYGSHGLYYITICTKKRIHYFGDVVVETRKNIKDETNDAKDKHNYASLRVTEMGKTATEYWHEIPVHYPFVELDEFVVMPNHLHGILFLNKPNYTGWNENKFGPQSQNLPAVIKHISHQ
jgi:putative transposase